MRASNLRKVPTKQPLLGRRNTSSLVRVVFSFGKADPSQKGQDVAQAAWLRLLKFQIFRWSLLIQPAKSQSYIAPLPPTFRSKNTAPNNGIKVPHSSITEASSKSWAALTVFSLKTHGHKGSRRKTMEDDVEACLSTLGSSQKKMIISMQVASSICQTVNPLPSANGFQFSKAHLNHHGWRVYLEFLHLASDFQEKPGTFRPKNDLYLKTLERKSLIKIPGKLHSESKYMYILLCTPGRSTVPWKMRGNSSMPASTRSAHCELQPLHLPVFWANSANFKFTTLTLPPPPPQFSQFHHNEMMGNSLI